MESWYHNGVPKSFCDGETPHNVLLFWALDTSVEKTLQRFRESCLEDLWLTSKILPHIQGGTDHWVTTLRKVLARGITGTDP